jgi:hypothetical protein
MYLRCLNLTCSLLLGFLAGVGCAQQGGDPSGLIVVGPEEHDFGKHYQDEVLTHDFPLVNKALTPVQIVEVSTSCGCLVAENVKESIGPGESVSLPIRFTTGAAQETASGNIRVAYREVDDSAASGQPKYVSLRVRADVIPDYHISPKALDFGIIDGLAVQQVSRIFRVAPEAMPDMEISEVHPSNAFLGAKILPKEADGSAFSIAVTLDASRFTHSESFSGSVVFSTNSKRVPKAIVYVRGKYNAPAQIEPNMLVIGSDERGEVERELRIKTTHPARIHSVRCAEDKRARIEFDNRLVAQEHVLHMLIAACQEKPLDCEMQLQLELFTDGGRSTFRTLRVPVHRFSQKGVENE